ncbi:MAG TPA: ATP-binding protein [Candidatus Microsaccharimonas sp.]|nr:ATP-binding protein [Candidatus Microsaccharimonas sp.]
MEYYRRFRQQLLGRILLIIVIDNLAVTATWLLGTSLLGLHGIELVGLVGVVAIVVAVILSNLSVGPLSLPTRLITEAIFHVAPETAGTVPAPDPTSTKFGQELVASVIHDVFELATVAETQAHTTPDTDNFSHDFVANALPLPLVITDAKDTIVYANEVAGVYIGVPAKEMIGKNVYDVLDMLFPSEDTLDTWLASKKSSTATASASWERVRLSPADTRPLRMFDLAAHYNRDNPHGYETILVLFDHTKAYSQDDQAISFIALSVHELRTPLTLLRGYIEAFEDEFVGKLSPDMNDFMFKMSATAQQLTAFVNNILNVARIDDDQLVLQLHEEKWGDVIRAAANSLALRAKVRGITIEYSVAPDLPTVGADRVSVLEVINNLVDNAIKYSGDSKRIVIATRLNAEGLVETTVQDFGVGIPANVLPNLFTKFYRDHHNRAQIGGTGLGLYLSKAIIHAHGGTIWVKSNKGEGSTFGFTLVPFSNLTDELKDSVNKDITRGAHGWIKNHSLYRR